MAEAEESKPDTLEIEVDPKALDFLKKTGYVYVLTDVENPQYSYYKIKGYDADLKIKFEEFVEVCKTYPEPQSGTGDLRAEFVVTIFKVTNPLNSMPSNLGFYLPKSGFKTVEDWLKTVKEEEIPECESGRKKTLYLYNIQTY